MLEDRERNPVEADDLLAMLLRARDDEGTLTPRRGRDEAVTFMVAGHETTANGMAWMWHLLALDAASRERMLDEADSVLTAKDVPRLPWASACCSQRFVFDAVPGHPVEPEATLTLRPRRGVRMVARRRR